MLKQKLYVMCVNNTLKNMAHVINVDVVDQIEVNVEPTIKFGSTELTETDIKLMKEFIYKHGHYCPCCGHKRS